MPEEEEEHGTFLEYYGVPGATKSCMSAVERILLSRGELARCVILTCRKPRHPSHALLLEDACGDEAVVKSGFTSGYGGEGPKGLSATLALLDWHGVALDEVEIEEDIIDRLDASAMTTADLAIIKAARPIRPRRLWGYILDQDETGPGAANPWRRRELTIPFQILDDRLAVLARNFWMDPDHALLKAHRMLEEAVKVKAQISQDEANKGPGKIFSAAFNPPGKLHWPGVGPSEQTGRANLFIGTVSAYRNPRAHRELNDRSDEALLELLLVNLLFRLEAEAERRPT